MGVLLDKSEVSVILLAGKELSLCAWMGYHNRMAQHILFLHGAGEGAYKEDSLLAQRLQRELGTGYTVSCPELPDEANAPYELWKQRVEKEIHGMQEPVILVGHSIGGSHLAKIMTEVQADKPVAGIFLLEAPFWGGEGWHYEGYKEIEIPEESFSKLPKGAKIFIYHTRDDEIVPFDHLALYAKHIPQAVVREIATGGHQLADTITPLVEDIRNL